MYNLIGKKGDTSVIASMYVCSYIHTQSRYTRTLASTNVEKQPL